MVKIDMWSHFGHAYITKIDEGEKWGKRGRGDTVEEQEAYQLNEKFFRKYHQSYSKINENAVAADEERDTFTLKEIKERVESTDGKSWKPIFKEGVLRIEVEAIERGLESFSATEDIRYDFTFYTPSCRDIRVKVF